MTIKEVFLKLSDDQKERVMILCAENGGFSYIGKAIFKVTGLRF